MERGRYPEAIEKLRRARQLEDASWVVASLGCAYAASGNRVEAQKILDELTERSKHGFTSRRIISHRFMRVLGIKRKRSGSWSRQRKIAQSGWYGLRSSGCSIIIRTDPRFVELRQRVGPPQ